MSVTDLPPHLGERVRATDAALRRDGEFVLYWMHHAARADENPALDVAIHAAHALRRPLLVYQELGGAHRCDSDRHHTFILEGARDVAARLTERGIRHVFHLATERGAATPLRALAARAALVVTEDFPAPPFPVWTRRLAAETRAAVWRVDTACVAPMRLVGRAYQRAFEFRRAWGRELERRAALEWPAVAVAADAFEDTLDFAPLDLAAADFAALCAACPIDHSIGPVPSTRGGQQAAEARWEAFKANGLASYDRLRNDALVQPPRGVSRLSAYLHHGHLSPLRIAREAQSHGSPGARKFNDELLIWRELAHNFCYRLAEEGERLESLAALPVWARETLAEHAGDRRHVHYSWERLARGNTGDALWDAAQASLRIHGELHNNVRMTWGKALLRWTPDPQRALELLIDLNHRYALDGSDPNSYGGLLWCLGLFDRPFKPPQAVYGTVRARPTSAHAARLNVDAYAQHTRRRSTHSTPRIAIVGAGMAGLAAARTLADQGFVVEVLERSSAVGGRMATRNDGPHTFDHGAQYFTARDPLFQRHVDAWIAEGCVAPWNGRIESPSGGRDGAAPPRYVGVPGMRAVAEHMAGDLDIRLATPIETLIAADGRWQVGDGRFDAVVLAMPPEQAAPLLGAVPTLSAQVAGFRSLPCWSAMVAFETELELPFDAAFVSVPPLAWIARDSSKPGRAAGERWVLHADPDWSAARLEQPREAIAAALLDAFFAIAGVMPRATEFSTAHRWQYARSPQNVGEDSLWERHRRLVVCGDWCRRSRVEDAFLSGVSAASRLVASFTLE